MTQILISSSLLILVVIALRFLLGKKISHRLRYALWLLVALRLLIPVQLGHSQYSVATLTQQAAQSQPAQQLRQELQQPVSGPSRAQLYQQLLNDYLENAPEQTVPAQVQLQLRQEAETQPLAPTPTQIITGIWLLGSLVMAVWFLITDLRFLRHAQKDAQDFPQEGIPVPVRICPNVPTPCLVGLFRPRICLTPASTEDARSLRHVLTHEVTHLRHLDHIWAWVRCLCLCVYWFDPLVWAAALLSKRDCELACDEGALKKLGDQERIPYGRTLLDTVTQHRSPAHILETATAMNETAKQLKERVSFIVKKPRNLWITAVCATLIAAIAVGCTFTGSKLPAADQNPQLLVDLVHQAESMVENNDTVTLDVHDHLTAYIENNAEKLQKAVTVTDTAITLDTTDPHYQVPEGDLILDVDVTIDLIYLTFLDLLTDRYGDGLARADLRYDAGFDHFYDLDLFFYPQYQEEGFRSVSDCCDAVKDGSHTAPGYSFYLSLDEPSIRWAVDPVQELREDESQPPAPTQPPTTVTTLPLENTEGPDPVVPSDATHLFADPSGWYTKALTSIYSAPEQVDIAAFFADGFPYESTAPTEEEWALLKDVEGFRRDEHFRRMKKSDMDQVLMTVFGITLDQTQGVGLDRLTYLEETDCYYFMSAKSETPQIWIDETTARPDYFEYTDGSGNRYYVNLTVTDTGSGYDYKIHSHRMEPTDRQLTTIALAKELGYSYAEFLYLSQTQIEDHLSQLGYADAQTLPLVGMDTIAMYERSLIEAGDQIRLRYRFLSLTNDEPLKQWYVRDFEGRRYEEPYLSATSHRWLLGLEETVDGAYTDSFYALLTDALFSAPKELLQAVSQCPEDQRQRIAEALPQSMTGDELSAYLALLETVEQDLRYSDGDTAALEALLQLKDACCAPAPTLPAELSGPIDKYAQYRAVGVCCDYEDFYEDMSHRLTEAQKQDYCGYQYRLTCCDSKEEILDHIRRYMAEDLIDHWPDDLLFTGDDGSLYLIVIPQGMVNYFHPVLAEGANGSPLVYSGAYSENGYLRTVAFELERSRDHHRIVSTETLAPATYGYIQCDGLHLWLDADLTVEGQVYRFHGSGIKGTVCRSAKQDSLGYAFEKCRAQAALYEEAWIDDWGQQIWYTVLRSPGITELYALIVDGDDAWELHLQSPAPSLLPYMIFITTDNSASSAA